MTTRTARRPLSSYDYPAIARNVSGHAWRVTRDESRRRLHRVRATAGWSLAALLATISLVLLMTSAAIEALARWLVPQGYQRVSRWLE